MNQDYEDVFSFVFNEECNKIPKIFRFFSGNKKRLQTVAVILAVLFVAILVLSSVWYSTGSSSRVDTVPGHTSLPFTTYDDRVLVVMIIVAAILGIIALWLELCVLFEKRAFKKASMTAARVSTERRHIRELKWQEWKAENRDY